MARIDPKSRPLYPPEERLAILLLRSSCGWSVRETARRFQVSAATIADWMKRLAEEGNEALLRTPVPVNKFGDFVQLTVQQLKRTCPHLGVRKTAEVLARAGLHLSASTIRRLRARPPPKPPDLEPASKNTDATVVSRTIRADYPNHVWNADLTVAPISGGFWVSWLPEAVRQSWPFGWWFLVVVDHFSRKLLTIHVFWKQPSGEEVCQALSDAVQRHGSPKHLITDKGPQFTSDEYEVWCVENEVNPRYGALGKHGSIALSERVVLTFKTESLQHVLMPLSLKAMQAEADDFVI